jgi:hypothetical protein
VAIVNGYTTLAQLRAKLTIPTADTADDTMLENIVEAVSRWIDAYTGRIFYTTGSETRVYTPTTPLLTITDDIATITSVKIDTGSRAYGTTLASTDYDTLPFNTAATVMPIMGLQITPNGTQRFYPTISKSVQVAGTFGTPSGCTWLEIVREACEIQASRIYKRKDSPFGVAGTGALGQVTLVADLDADVKALLAYPIRRLVKP